RWEIRPTESNPNVIICRLHTPEENPGFNRTQLALMSAHIPELIRQVALGEHVVWFYTPMALPLVEHFTPKAVIYDCMDELSGFLGAPPELIDREEKLLKLADVVFTGGPSLFRAKQHRHPNVHCFPSSVDAAHY